MSPENNNHFRGTKRIRVLIEKEEEIYWLIKALTKTINPRESLQCYLTRKEFLRKNNKQINK